MGCGQGFQPLSPPSPSPLRPSHICLPLSATPFSYLSSSPGHRPLRPLLLSPPAPSYVSASPGHSLLTSACLSWPPPSHICLPLLPGHKGKRAGFLLQRGLARARQVSVAGLLPRRERPPHDVRLRSAGDADGAGGVPSPHLHPSGSAVLPPQGRASPPDPLFAGTPWLYIKIPYRYYLCILNILRRSIIENEVVKVTIGVHIKQPSSIFSFGTVIPVTNIPVFFNNKVTL
jgi:hypothetical protein